MDYLGPRNKTKQTQMRLGQCDSQVLLLVLHMYSQTTLMDSCLIRTGERKPFSVSIQLDTDTPLIRTLSMVPSVCVLTGFDCALAVLISLIQVPSSKQA